MLASLKNAELSLLHLFWGMSLFFMGIAILLISTIIIRRIIRNRTALRRQRQRTAFQSYMSAVINHGTEDAPPICHIQDMTDVFLNFFRTLKGEKLELLKDMLSGSEMEARIIENTRKGIRGTRMRALRTLSYLYSQTSLQVIFESLSSEDKYIRLTAMRCLARRKATVFLLEIIRSYFEAFPRDYKLLASILAKFGKDIVEPLETQLRSSDDALVKTACLEALSLIMPYQSSLDFRQLMQHESETVRGAALSYAAVCQYPEDYDPLRDGLEDEAISVKIRAAKMACQLKRADLMPQLYTLSNDPNLWVRYWALRAIWVKSGSGQKFVSSLTQSNPMAASVALEMRSGYV